MTKANNNAQERGIGRHLQKGEMKVSPDSTGDSFCISLRGWLRLCATGISFRFVPRWETGRRAVLDTQLSGTVFEVLALRHDCNRFDLDEKFVSEEF